ncbi:MAG: hypothetical protein CMK32_02605 [Porticoccaceae bacterium]|nr:hypothetical protein [Porticoccaceae bacterium]
METEQNINLLLVHDHIEEANRVVSLLRNANYRVDPQYAGNPTDLNKKIQERNWDLAIVQYDCQTIPNKTLFHQIRRLNKDIPTLLTIPELAPGPMVDGLKMGASNVVPADEDQLLIHIVGRILYDLEQRRKQRYWKRRFSESENRFESLIMSSQDGIAIIQEGTFVLVNDTFAKLLGYGNHEDMELLPVVDSIAKGYQFDFKKYLKPLDFENAIPSENMTFEAVMADEHSTLPIRAQISQIDYHGEPAIQLLVGKEFISEPASLLVQASEDEESANPGKIRLNEMLGAINGAITRSAKTGEDSLLYYLQIDQHGELQKRLGIGESEEGIQQLARFIEQHTGDTHAFGRIREDAFIVIGKNRDTEESLAFSESIIKKVEEQVFETEEGSFSCTLSIGITPINEASISADGCLANSLQAIADLGTDQGTSGLKAKFYEPVFESSSASMPNNELVAIGKQLISNNLIDVAYQPIVGLKSSGLELYESRMTIKPGTFKDGLPSDFISSIFALDIGKELDRCVIAQALKDLAPKCQASADIKLFVNINDGTILDETFLPWFKRQLQDNHVAPSHIVIQLRETDLSKHFAKAAALLAGARNMGAETCISHFGLAINPMAILNKLRFHYVKMDHYLAEKAQKSQDSMASLKELMGQLKSEGQRVIVPHIETASIIPALWQADVDFLQGNYIQQPQLEMNFDFSAD